MALSGGSWGTREELLHPRDRLGRFRRKWSLPKGTVDRLMSILDAFKPRSFGSQQQASQWAFNQSARKGASKFQDFARLGDYGNTNNDLRAGRMTPSTQQFVTAYDKAAFDSDEDMVLYRRVGPEAFGISPEMMNAEEGGVEDTLLGTTIVDKGYTSTNVGAPIGNGPITMAIAAPKGTKMMAPARSQSDPQIILDRDQKLHVSKVEPDGRGGWNVMAVITDQGGPEEHDVVSQGEVPTDTVREAGVQRQEEVRLQRQGVLSDRQVEAEAGQRVARAQEAQGQLQQEQQQRLARMGTDRPVPQGPGPAPRTEPLQSEMLGGRPPTPVEPEAEPEPVRLQDFRQAFRDANIEVPSAGARRRQFNAAYLGILQGKRDPEDLLRELEADIRDNDGLMDDLTTRDTPIAEVRNLEADNQRLTQLADLIAEQHGFERREMSQARRPTPEPEAPSDIPPEGASRGGTDISGLTDRQKADVENRVRRLKAEGRFNPQNEEHQRVQNLVDQIEAEREGREIPAPFEQPRVSGVPQLEARQARKAAKKAAAPVKKATPAKAAPAKPTDEMTPEERIARLDEILRGENVPGEEAEEGDPLEAMSRNELVEEAKRRGIDRVPTSWNKTKIKDAIRSGEVRAKAAPATKATSAEATEAGDLDNMTKNDLIAEAGRRNVEVKNWWTKDRIKQAIRGEQAPAKPAKKAAAPAKKAAPTKAQAAAEEVNLTRLEFDEVADLTPDQAREYGRLRGDGLSHEAAVRQATSEAEVAPTPDRPESTRDLSPQLSQVAEGLNLDERGSDRRMLQSLQEKLNGSDTIFKGNDIGRPLTQREIADEIDDMLDSDRGPGRQARNLARGSAEGGLDPAKANAIDDLKRRERDWRRLSNRLRGRHQETGIDNPVAEQRLTAADRIGAFEEAFIKKFRVLDPDRAARRSILEVQDDISMGRITPAEGVRRLESDIEFNKDDLATIDEDLRNTDNPKEIADLRKQKAALTKDIQFQERASQFIRDHFREAPEVTPGEIRERLPEPVRQQLDEATPEQIKETAKLTGVPEPKGNTKEEMTDDLLSNLAEQSAARAAARRANTPQEREQAIKDLARAKLDERLIRADAEAPVKSTPAPAVLDTPSTSRYQRIDINTVADGLQLGHADDQKVVRGIQATLDSEKTSPAAIGKGLLKAVNSPTGLRTRASLLPEGRERDDLNFRANEMEKLAERLMRTRRKANKPAAPRDPNEGKVTPDEQQELARAADLTGISVERLQAQAQAKKDAEASAKPISERTVDVLRTVGSEEEGRTLLTKKLKAELVDIAKAAGVPVKSKDTKPVIMDNILKATVKGDGGRDLGSEVQVLSRGTTPEERAGTDLPTVQRSVPSGPDVVRRWQFRAGADIAQRTGRTNGDEPLVVPNGGADQGALHLDSEVGQLWADLVSDNRAPNSQVNRVARAGEALGRGQQTLDGDVIPTLRDMALNAPDSGVRKRIQKTIDEISAPEANYRLPDSTPQEIRDWIGRMASIPTMRKPDGNKPSMLEQKIDIIHKVDRGDIDPEEAMRQLAREPHESVDGGYVQQADTRKVFAGRPLVIRRWARGQDRETAGSQQAPSTAPVSAPEAPAAPTPAPAKATRALMAPQTRRVEAPVTGPGVPTADQISNPADLLEALNLSDDVPGIRRLLDNRKFSKQFLSDSLRINDVSPSKGSKSTRADLVDDLIKQTGSRRPAALDVAPAPAKKAPAKRTPKPPEEKFKGVTNAKIEKMNDDQLLELFEHESRKDVVNAERLQFIYDVMGRREQASEDEAARRAEAEAPLYEEVDRLVEGGMDPRQAYAQAFNLDPEQVEQEDLRRQLDRFRAPGVTREQQVRTLYKEQVAIAYVQAEAETNGHMLNPAGRAAGIDPFTLFTGPRARAEKYASDELKDFWDAHGRTTYTEFRGQMLGGRADRAATRAAREGERGFRR